MRLMIKPCQTVVLMLAGVLVGLGSCNGDKESVRGDGMTFESFIYNGKAQDADLDSIRMELEDYSGLWDIKSEGVLPLSAGKHDVKALRDTLMRLASVQNVDDKIQALLPPTLSATTEATDSVNAESLLINRVSVNLMTPQLLVMQVFNYSYSEGAAHGNYSTTYINYDMESGKILTLPDIFQAGYERMLLPKVVKQLVERGDLIVEEEEIMIPQNFRVTEDGIEFVYSLYSVAPYSSGEPRVLLYSGDLEDVLTPLGKTVLELPYE